MEEQLKELTESLKKAHEKLDVIEKKTAGKWVLPVALLVLTATFGAINYFIEKNIDVAFVAEQKRQEIITTFKAESQRDFYKDAQLTLHDLYTKLEAFCRFRDQDSRLLLGKALNEFNTFRKKQAFIEDDILEHMEEYSVYVAESFHHINSSQTITQSETDQALADAANLRDTCLDKLNKGLQNLME